MKKVNLTGNPFYLDQAGIDWVNKTFNSMTNEQKCGQLFCPMGLDANPGNLNHLINEIGVGAMMYRPGTADNIRQTHKEIQEMADIPLLLAANTESGGEGLAFEGTSFGKPMAVAATGDYDNAYKMAYTACAEGAALGLNWSFAPIVDINYDFHNPITNVRTFGDKPEQVYKYASRYLDAADECNVAVSIKHFPGDGVDERDQHIVTSINSLSTDEWDESYGYVYGKLIEQGAKTVMVGHIAQPAYVKKLNPSADKAACMTPATLSQELLQGLLRDKLGFNGLITTDATPMVGFTSAMSRAEAIPTAIEAGCDMILFNKDVDEDYRFMLEGLANNKLSQERLDEAVIRILATKASLKLHEKKTNNSFVSDDFRQVVGCQQHRDWSDQVADQAITLVRDEKKLLPITPSRYKRIYLNVIQKDLSPENAYVQMWREKLQQRGFEVTVRDRRVSIGVEDFADMSKLTPEKGRLLHEMYRGVEEMKQDYDLYLYICNMENASNNTTLRLNWNVCFGLGDDAPWFASEIPTMMISTAYPYHLYDAPMMGTYINTYSGNENFVDATIAKIMGESEFKGVSPIDPYCGKKYI